MDLIEYLSVRKKNLITYKKASVPPSNSPAQLPSALSVPLSPLSPISPPQPPKPPSATLAPLSSPHPSSVLPSPHT